MDFQNHSMWNIVVDVTNSHVLNSGTMEADEVLRPVGKAKEKSTRHVRRINHHFNDSPNANCTQQSRKCSLCRLHGWVMRPYLRNSSGLTRWVPATTLSKENSSAMSQTHTNSNVCLLELNFSYYASNVNSEMRKERQRCLEIVCKQFFFRGTWMREQTNPCALIYFYDTTG